MKKLIKCCAAALVILGSFELSAVAADWHGHPRFTTDSDGDNIPDEWEQAFFGDLTTADAHSDSDGDGSSDLEEFNNFLDRADPYNGETLQTEAQRRLPPMISELDMSEELNASQTYAVTWKMLGYDSDYSVRIALFDCTGIADGSFYSYEMTTASQIAASQWAYSGEPAGEFTYTFNLVVPATRDGGAAWSVSGTPIVVRFYQKNAKAAAAGKNALSLMVPGNATETYYDATGRRIQKTVCPSSGCQ